MCNSRAVQGLIPLSLPWIRKDELAVQPLNSPVNPVCQSWEICLGSLNLLAERVGKPLAGGNGNGQQVGRGEVRKSFPFLLEPFMLDIRGGENLPYLCPANARKGLLRDFQEGFFRIIQSWVCSMASFGFSQVKSVQLHSGCCEQFMHKALTSPAVGVSPEVSASRQCHCKEQDS